MKKMVFNVLALCLAAMLVMAQEDDILKNGHPDQHVVRKGDTLWDISSKFLNDPWLWPEIWQVNPQIANPHLIYPGDLISLIYLDGRPRLTLARGDVKLSPAVRSKPIDEAIPAIQLDKINAFLSRSRILEDDQLDNAPYVIAGAGRRVITGAGDRLYARGQFPADEYIYGIYRPGQIFIDPQTGEVLGKEAIDIGMGKVVGHEEDIATLALNRSNEEVRVKDRLLPYVETKIKATFYPSAPKQDVNGVIMAVEGGVTQVGSMDIVVLNRGTRDGLEDGNILAIDKVGEVVRDQVTNEAVRLPDEESGLLMIFRVFDKMSYGLVLSSNQPLAVMDKVRKP
jgi:nucleoid-associated protein YgaU